MGQESERTSVATRIGLILASVTVIISAINAIPALMALRGKDAYVVYDIAQSQMIYPKDSDRRAIGDLLKEKHIPDAFCKIHISNRGDVPSHEVMVTVAVPGVIVAERADPDPSSKPAWVRISKDYDPTADPSRIHYTLSELALARSLEIDVSYMAQPFGEVNCDVFYDGKPAVRVESIGSVPENARSISFLPALKILGLGILLSGLAFVALKYRDQVVPSLPWRVRRAGDKLWRNYKNSVVLELAKNPNIAVESIAEGSIDAREPRSFWDGILTFDGIRFAVEVHTDAQRWDGIIGHEDEQLNYGLRLFSMATSDPTGFALVAVINDVDCWSKAPGSRLKTLVDTLAKSERSPTFVFVSGTPAEAAVAIVIHLSTLKKTGK